MKKGARPDRQEGAMKVLVVQSSPSASVHYRVDEPVRAIRDSGIDVEIDVVRGLATTMAPGAGDQLSVIDVDAGDADVVVLQLPKTPEMLQSLRVLQGRGVAVVVEIDDLMSAAPPGHGGMSDERRNRLAAAALACAREADLVTATSPALLREYARHGRGSVVPNAVPRRIAELPPAYERSPDVVTVGWAGHVLGHLYDLQQVGSGLQQALDRTRGRGRALILGARLDARERLGLAEEPAEIPWVNGVDAYSTTLGEVFDIGIAPLRDDRFNTAKSWLKPLEYAARGVYCVRSRTDEYERLGLGLPARNPKDWAKWLTVGIEDADRRREFAARARETVLSAHLTEHTAERWVAAWRSATDHRARSGIARAPAAARGR
jgi:hypothetical protein